MKNFVYLEHTADAEFIAYGRTIDEAFANAALAMTGLMVDPKTVSPAATKSIELSGDALDTLLYDWLSELLYVFEVDRLVFGKFEVHVKEEGGAYRLKARALGEGVDRHPEIFLHIKAVTFHDLRFEKRNNIYEAQVLLDI
ncbi:MAG TPA: archease [Methanocella sp.]|nr:archease [Methanocella sp.]